MTLLILEDYVQIRDAVKEALTSKELFKVIYTAGTIEEALKISEEHNISMFMVDLTLPDGSGYDFIKSIRCMETYKNSWVVIATGREESIDEVTEAYNTNRCQRYIRKPFTMTYLIEMFEDLKTKRIVDVGPMRKLRIKRKSVDYYFNHCEIIFVETVDKTAYLYTKDKKQALGRVTLSNLEEWLPENQFIRVHRSYIVNKDYIDYVSRNNSQSQIKLKYYEEMIPIGRTYKECSDRI